MEKLIEVPAEFESMALALESSRPKASIPALCEPQPYSRVGREQEKKKKLTKGR